MRNEGFEIRKFYDSLEALWEIKRNPDIELAILDVMMPGMDGFSLCAKIRETHAYPIIMLTARVEDVDKITGLTIGADDYVTKPFNPLELLARVKAQLRRYKRYSVMGQQTAEFFERHGLYISKQEHTVTLFEEPVNLTILLVQIINEFYPMMEDKNITVVQEIEPELVLSADADKLARVFDNLFRNAVNYSYTGTEIVCNARKGNDCILVTIKNKGDHIPPEKLERIFDRFFRLDSSRQSSTGGAGLGLAIAKQIVELHDGTIEAVCKDGVTEFRIVLPV